MSELIGGKEAMIALANGEEVEVRSQFIWKWVNLKDVPEYRLIDILENNHCDQFRIKSRTIIINSIEVPAPFEPKEDCIVFIIDDGKTCNYCQYDYEFGAEDESNWIGIWRTEEEIKQVVAALRKVFKGEQSAG